MKYGICLLSLIPQRAEPSEKSEMVNQLLFGEIFSITDEKNNWLKIYIDYDGYEGWIDRKMATEIDEDYYLELKKQEAFVNPKPITIFNYNKISNQFLTPGSSLFNINEEAFLINGSNFKFIEKTEEKIDFESLTTQFLNTPYLWGGKSIFGIDCSGFVQVIYKILGVTLPRDASEQSKIGSTINFIQETKMGDLAYFDNEEGNITHVGILLNNQSVIHASGYVRIDKIDSHGIFNTETDCYSHKLRIIKRLDNFTVND